jgi:LysR family hydrogen peroxide-inducible transcriptional activator
VELHQLRYVLAVAETKSFTKAAEKLFVVQSNVSAQVRKLEQELGVTLFERRTHDVVLTEFGRAFVPAVRQSLEALQQARAALDDVRDLSSGRAALGASGTIANRLLPEIVRRFKAAYPGVYLWVTKQPSHVLEGMVAARDLSQALVNLPISPQYRDDLTHERLFDEELVAVVPPDHALRGREIIALADLAGTELLLPAAGNPMRSLIVDACEAAGFTPLGSVELGTSELTTRLAYAGLGVAFVPEHSARNALPDEPDRIVRVEGSPLVRSVVLITHRSALLSPADRALAEVLRAMPAATTRRGTSPRPRG